MSGSQERSRLVEYQPTAIEIEMLKEEGLTLQELLQFNQPTEEELKALQFS